MAKVGYQWWTGDRAKQIGTALAFEVYYQCCNLSDYKVVHFLEAKFLPAGKYIRFEPSLPIPIRLLNKIFPFGKNAHAEYIPYTIKAAEEMRKSGKQIEVIEISYKLTGNVGN